MIYLILSIVSSSLIFIVFRWLGNIKVSTFLVIVLNYLVATIWGFSIVGWNELMSVFDKDWFWGVYLLGSAFPPMFYIIALATQRVGASTSSVTNKMSVVIPVVMAFFLYGDDVTTIKIIGITLALIGIFFASMKNGKLVLGANALLLLAVFMGSGLIDGLIKFLQDRYLDESDTFAFTAVLFLAAFVMGAIIVLMRSRTLLVELKWIKLPLGFILGSVNFASIYYLVMALSSAGIESSTLFPVNNIGIVLLSTFLSILLFKERLTKMNWLGIAVSIGALIVLMQGA